MLSSSDRSGGGEARIGKYKHYLFVSSLLTISVCVLALLNAYFRIDNVTSYSASQTGVPASILLAGYLGMFFSILVLPVPDYVLVPVYGYLSSVGLFNPVATFVVCIAASVFPVEYVCGRYMARPLVKRILPFFLLSERELETADKWLVEHGKFSVFISTFIPFFYSAVCLVAGTLRMEIVEFMLSCIAGFGLRFAFLEYAGYYSVYVFAASFDYSQRFLFETILAVSLGYAAFYMLTTFHGRLERASMAALVG